MAATLQRERRTEAFDRESAEMTHGSVSSARKHPVDFIEPEEAEDIMSRIGERMVNLCVWALDGGDAVACRTRVMVMVYSINPDAVGYRSEVELANALQVTRAAVSKSLNEFRDVVGGITTSPMRGERTRRLCKKAQQN